MKKYKLPIPTEFLTALGFLLLFAFFFAWMVLVLTGSILSGFDKFGWGIVFGAGVPGGMLISGMALIAIPSVFRDFKNEIDYWRWRDM